jgi:hypothetical protein
MPNQIELFVDFNNADRYGRIRLNTNGTFDDIDKYHIKLESGLEVLLNDGDSLKAKGIIEFSDEEKIWVAKIDWNKLIERQKNPGFIRGSHL